MFNVFFMMVLVAGFIASLMVICILTDSCRGHNFSVTLGSAFSDQKVANFHVWVALQKAEKDAFDVKVDRELADFNLQASLRKEAYAYQESLEDAAYLASARLEADKNLYFGLLGERIEFDKGEIPNYSNGSLSLAIRPEEVSGDVIPVKGCVFCPEPFTYKLDKLGHCAKCGYCTVTEKDGDCDCWDRYDEAHIEVSYMTEEEISEAMWEDPFNTKDALDRGLIKVIKMAPDEVTNIMSGLILVDDEELGRLISQGKGYSLMTEEEKEALRFNGCFAE
jgi:hypothetical protein